MRIKHLPAGFVVPAQPVKAPKPPVGTDWAHEIKHDGYRIIVRRDGPTVRLYWSNVAVPIAAVFLPAIWPWLALNIKRLRDSGHSARFVVPLMSAWLFAGGSLLAGSLKLFGR